MSANEVVAVKTMACFLLMTQARRPPHAPQFPPHGLSFTYHPGLAAEVVYGVERVDSRKPSILKADDQAAVVLSQGHAVGMLSNQDEVRFEGPAKRGTTVVLSHGNITKVCWL